MLLYVVMHRLQVPKTFKEWVLNHASPSLNDIVSVGGPRIRRFSH